VLQIHPAKKDPMQKPSVALQSVMKALKGKRTADGFRGAQKPS
jgi:hypothetical protein